MSDMQDRQSCRVCGRACSSTVGLCRSAVCTSALVEQLEAELAELRENYEQATEHLRLLGEYPDTKPGVSYRELEAENAKLREALTSISTALDAYGVRWCRDVAKEALLQEGE